MLSPYNIKLPEKMNHLIMMYLTVSKIINSIWTEYTCYCETISNLPQTALIFPIIFNELDFYEVLLVRISSHLPEDVLSELRHEEDFWHW